VTVSEASVLMDRLALSVQGLSRGPDADGAGCVVLAGRVGSRGPRPILSGGSAVSCASAEPLLLGHKFQSHTCVLPGRLISQLLVQDRFFFGCQCHSSLPFCPPLACSKTAATERFPAATPPLTGSASPGTSSRAHGFPAHADTTDTEPLLPPGAEASL
jgi:hypothetical protein